MFVIIMYQNCVVTVTFCMYQEHRSTKKNNSKLSLSQYSCRTGILYLNDSTC